MFFPRFGLPIFICIVIELFFHVEVFVLLPVLEQEVNFFYILHFTYGLFALLNVIGNLFYAVFTETSITMKHVKTMIKSEGAVIEGWNECCECNSLRPPRSFHCYICKKCILKRDHHCHITGFCVGYYNYRYFYMFTMHVMIAMLYSMYLNVKLLVLLTEVSFRTILKIIVPAVHLLSIRTFNIEDLCCLMICLNILCLLLSGGLLLYHTLNLISGRTCKENAMNISDYDLGWKANITDVLGKRWYLTWISPFIQSPLPGTGLSWVRKTS